MNNKTKLFLQSILIHSPFKGLYEEGLLHETRLLFVNWMFQRIFGINGDVPWSVHFTSRVTNSDKIILGKGVKKSFVVSSGCYIQGGNGIVIKEGTIFAPGVKIISANHGVDGENRGWTKSDPVVIGKNCWIGANAVILPNVVLGDYVVVGAGAVVTHSFPEYSILAGIPAKVIREIKK